MKRDNIKKSIKLNLINATKWSAITEILAKLITPISSIVLARILVPETFGIIASINMVVSFCDIFTDAGFQKYIIQYESEDKEFFNQVTEVAFWSNLLFSIVIWAIIIFFSSSLAKLVGCEGKETAIYISCILLPLHALSSIPSALLKREMNFRALFTIRIATLITPFFITLPLAFITKSYWSLICGSLVNAIVTVIITFVKIKWRPKLFFSINILKKMFSFSLWSVLEAILVWLINWGDMFIVGSFLTSYYLGIYKTSINMINSIIAVISASVTPVMLSALSRLQNEEDEYNKIFYNISFYSGIFLIPMGIGMLIYKKILCNVLLGSAWSEGATLMGIWGLISAIAILFNTYNGCVYISRGKPQISVFVQIVQIILIIPAVYFSVQANFVVLSYTRALIRVVGMLINCIIVWILFKISAFKTIKSLIPCIISGILMGVFGKVFLDLFSLLYLRLISIILCMVIYFMFLCYFPSMRKIIKFLYENLKLKSKTISEIWKENNE